MTYHLTDIMLNHVDEMPEFRNGLLKRRSDRFYFCELWAGALFSARLCFLGGR